MIEGPIMSQMSRHRIHLLRLPFQRTKIPPPVPGSRSNIKKPLLTSVVDTSSNKNAISTTSETDQPTRPIWLRKSILCAFCALFTLMWISLIVLWYFTNLEHGLALILSSNHLAWTYGPTAILVVVVSLWRQVDYHCKTVRPWQVLGKGWAPAPRTVLLDCLWPLQAVSFFRALKNKDFEVVLSVTAFAILKAITVISTGLFLLVPTSVTRTSTVLIDRSFNTSRFWASIPAFSGNGQPSGVIDAYQDASYNNLSSAPIYSYNGLLVDQVSSTEQIEKSFAFQTFSPLYDTDSVRLNSTMTIFLPKMSCEAAEVSPNKTSTSAYNTGFGRRTDVLLAACPTIDGDPIPTITPLEPINLATIVAALPNPNSTDLGYQPVYFQSRVNCSAYIFPTTDFINGYESGGVNSASSTNLDFRILVGAAKFPVAYNDTLNLTTYVDTPPEMIASICKVEYSMEKINIFLTQETGEFSFTPNDSSGQFNHLDGLSPTQLAELLFSLTCSAIEDGTGVMPNAYEIFGDDFSGLPLVYLMNQWSRKHASESSLWDQKIFSSAFSQTLGNLSIQLMRSYFLSDDHVTKSEATALFQEQRLQVRQPALWTMVALFVTLSVIPITIAILLGYENLPKAGTLIMAASAVTSNQKLGDLLQGARPLSSQGLRKGLNSLAFMRSNDGTVRFHDTSSSAEVSPLLADPDVCHKHGWRPLVVRHGMVFSIFGLFIVTIILLEVACQASVKHDGLLVVDNTFATYAIRYGSTLFVLLLATFSNSLDFIYMIVAPFSALSKFERSARDVILIDLPRHLPPIALYRALKSSHYGQASFTSAGLIGSLLTIVVSGLWLTEPRTLSNEVVIQLDNVWNWGWSLSADTDGQAGIRLNALQWASQLQSPTVVGGFVIPKIDSTSNITTKALPIVLSTTANTTLRMPALRPKLSCQAVPRNQTYMRYMGVDNYFVSWMKLSEACSQGQQEYLNFTSSFREGDRPETGNIYNYGHAWIGNLFDLPVGPWVNATVIRQNNENAAVLQSDSVYGITNEYYDSRPDNPAGCPSIGVHFGFYDTGGYDNRAYWDGGPIASPNLTALVCYQQMEEVQASATYVGNLSDTLFQKGHEPVVDESTARLLDNGTSGIDSFPYRVEPYLSQNLTQFPPTGNYVTQMDRFFNHLAFGPNGTRPEDMLGANHEQNLIDAVARLYQEYMVEVIDINFQQDVTGTDVGIKLNGTTQTNDTTIPKMDPTSKLILQILLSSMVVLGVLGYWLADLKGILPRNPCSLASNMALLAGSSLCQREIIPHGVEYKSEKELKRILADHIISLGWWDKTPNKFAEGSADQEGDPITTNIQNNARPAQTPASEPTESHVVSNKRFGLDTGRADVLGYARRKSWVRRRLNKDVRNPTSPPK